MRTMAFIFGSKMNLQIYICTLYASALFLGCLVSGTIDSTHRDQRNSRDPQPVSLCPSACACLEQKSKNADSEEPSGPMKSSKKATTEILKNGIRVQCTGHSQGPNPLISLKKLNLPALLMENTVILDLSSNGIKTVSGDDFTGNYPMLQKLVLKGNQVEEISSGALQNLENLKHLDLSNNQLNKLPLSIIKELKSVERVKLNGNPVNCDCNLIPFLQEASKRNIKIQGSCWSPPSLKEQPFSKLSFEELTCSRPKDSLSVEIRPASNQIVFEGDPLKLTCRVTTINPNVKLIWLHQFIGNQSTEVITAGHGINLTLISRNAAEDGQAILTESSLIIKSLQQIQHSGSWICSSIMGNRSLGLPITASKSVEVTVLSLSTPTCPGDVTSSNRGRYAWPRTMAGLKIQLPCQANSHAAAWRTCSSTGHWDEPDVQACSYLNEITKVLEQFAKTNLTFSKTSALESARRLKSYLNDVASLTDPHDALFVTRTLHNYLDATGRHPELLPIIMDVLSVLVKQDPVLLADSRHELLAILQQAPLKSPEFEYQSSSLAVEKSSLMVSGIGSTQSASEICTWKRNPDSTLIGSKSKLAPIRNRLRLDCVPSSGPINISGTDFEASIKIPLATDGIATSIQQQTVVLSLLSSPNPLVNVHSPLEIVTSVVGISSGHVTNLINRTVPFVITLRLLKSLTADRLLALVGARWNPYISEWSRDQCTLIGTYHADHSNFSFVTFQCCCGFGFFGAFVVRQSDQIVAASNSFQVRVSDLWNYLPPPVYVGSIVCLVCHLTAILTYLIHHNQLKMSRPTKHALINGWASISLLVTFFTVGVRSVYGKWLCQLVGLSLHYLTLSCLLWMLVGASGLYKKHLSQHGRSDGADSDQSTSEELNPGQEPVSKPALRFYLIGWGVPLIVVGIAGAIHLEHYGGLNNSGICFLAKTPAMGAVGLPSAILIFLILTFHLLTWCYLRHARKMQKQLADLANQSPEQPQAQPCPDGATKDSNLNAADSEPSINTEAARSSLVPTELTICVLNQSRADDYMPLGDGGSCPSNLTQATQTTEVSDLTSASSGQEQERIALLINRCQEPIQTGRSEAEGAGENCGSGRSELERPLLLVTSCSEDGLETAEDGTDHQEKRPDPRGHSNPLMSSFTDDSESKKLNLTGLLMTAQHQTSSLVHGTANLSTNEPDPDEKSPLNQLRGQLLWLVLFVMTWISALGVVSRPFLNVLPYDELLCSLSYAICSAAMGLHTLIFHLLTRKDVVMACCVRKSKTVPIVAAESVPAEAVATEPSLRVADQPIDSATPQAAVVTDPMELMNVVSLDPSVTLINSFYDPRQSKTARRFFQKQKMLNQTAQNNHLLNQDRYQHRSHRHSRHYNNTQSPVSHSPIAEEALLTSSSKAKVSNVNIHVELGAYDWHELQGRLSDQSWSKSGKSLLPANTQKAARLADSVTEPPVQPEPTVQPKVKRKRHGHHSRTSKKSKWEEEMAKKAAVLDKTAQPVYAFIDYDYRERALAQVCANDEALRTLTSVKIRVKDDDDLLDPEAIKRETSV